MPAFALAVLALFQGTTPPSPVVKPPPTRDAVVATVDGKPVTAAEVEPYLWAWRSRGIVRLLTDSRIIAAEAAKRGVTATDAEVQAMVDPQIADAKDKLQPGQTVDDYLALQGIDRAYLTLLARSAANLDKVAAADFKPADIVNVDTLAFPAPEGASTQVVAKAAKDADAAYASLAAGKSWEAVSKANTTPPLPPLKGEAPASGLALGWRPLDAFPESIRPQIAATKTNGVTKPVKTPTGIQIFRVSARVSDLPPAQIADFRGQFVKASRAAVLQRLRDAAKVEIK